MTLVQVDSSESDFSIYRRLLLLSGLALGIGAQAAISAGAIALGIAGYLAGVACVLAGVHLPLRETRDVATSAKHVPLRWRYVLTGLSIVAAIGTFVLSSGNLYRIDGVVLWLLSILCWWFAWAQMPSRSYSTVATETLPALFRDRSARQLTVVVMLVVILSIGAAFRFVQLSQNPLEMNSDHAEKLLDVNDVLNGVTHIFFERNTGREPWQFYWTVLLVRVFGLRPDFMALKIGTSLIGLLMLPAIYLLASEVFDSRTALIATLFAAVASWGVITSRFGLRYPLAPCAVAWTMYFLVRGLKRSERNSMLAAGGWIGIGMQGYTAYRFMAIVVPLVVVVWTVWAVVHRRFQVGRAAFCNALLAMIIAILVTMPLIRYGTERPDMLFYRAVTRLSGAEQPIAGNPVSIFANNIKNVLLMFNFTHDEVWVANLPDRPAMDPVLGALLILGAAGGLLAFIRQRSPWPLILLAAGALMLVPSALSIAFPRENPSVVRTGGALPLLMIVCAVIPGCLIQRAAASETAEHGTGGTTLLRVVTGPAAWAVVVGICAVVVGLNVQRVFADYPAEYCPRSQDASDIAHEMNAWVAAGHSRDNAWVIGYPYWVDSRAVGMWIGDIHYPNTAGASVGMPDAASVDLHGSPGWFALNESDSESLQSLKRTYSQGQARLITGAQCSDKRFIVYTTQ